MSIVDDSSMVFPYKLEINRVAVMINVIAIALIALNNYILMLAPQMTQDRHGLRQLEVPIDVVRQVGKGETLQVGIDLIDC